MKVAEKKPTDSSVVVMGGGAFIIIIGILAIHAYFVSSDASAIDLAEIITGTLAGAGVVLTGVFSLFYPHRHGILGVLAILLSVASFVGTSGGLYIGAFVSIIGAAMTISWHPGKSRSDSSTARNGH